MNIQCGISECNRTGLYLCRGCRDWVCGCFVDSYLDCNATEYPLELRGYAVCLYCEKEGVE